MCSIAQVVRSVFGIRPCRVHFTQLRVPSGREGPDDGDCEWVGQLTALVLTKLPPGVPQTGWAALLCALLLTARGPRKCT